MKVARRVAPDGLGELVLFVGVGDVREGGVDVAVSSELLAEANVVGVVVDARDAGAAEVVDDEVAADAGALFCAVEGFLDGFGRGWCAECADDGFVRRLDFAEANGGEEVGRERNVRSALVLAREDEGGGVLVESVGREFARFAVTQAEGAAEGEKNLEPEGAGGADRGEIVIGDGEAAGLRRHAAWHETGEPRSVGFVDGAKKALERFGVAVRCGMGVVVVPFEDQAENLTGGESVRRGVRPGVDDVEGRAVIYVLGAAALRVDARKLAERARVRDFFDLDSLTIFS